MSSTAHVVFAGEQSTAAPSRREAAPRTPLLSPLAGSQLPPETAAFFDWLCERRGLDARYYRPLVLGRREAACLRAAKAASLADARTRLEHDIDATDRVLSAMLIGVTSFFRDTQAFLALQAELQPLTTKAGVVRVASIACSDGPELYSVAMLLAELGLIERARLSGIDCRSRAIESARTAVFPADALAGVSEARRAAFFQEHASGLQIKPQLRHACRFHVGDALTLPINGGLDVVLCRNLAIYLNVESAERLWLRVVGAMRPGGLLMTGKAELPTESLPLVRVGPSLFRRVS